MKQFLSRWWGACLLLAAWYAWVRVNGVNQIVMPRPAAVLNDLAIHPVIYTVATLRTASVAFLGLVIGMAFGGSVAILARISPALQGLLTSMATMFASIPVVTIIPILARLFGYHTTTLVVIVALICFLPAFVYTSSGLRSVPPGSLDLFTVCGAGPQATMLLLNIPAALPYGMIALRLAAPVAILASLTAEYLMQTGGLGALIRTTASEFRSERTFGCALIATALSVCCFLAAQKAERAVARRWQ